METPEREVGVREEYGTKSRQAAKALESVKLMCVVPKTFLRGLFHCREGSTLHHRSFKHPEQPTARLSRRDTSLTTSMVSIVAIFTTMGGILLRHLNTLDRGVRPEAPFARVLIYGLFHLPSELFSQRSHLERFEPRVEQVGLTRTLGEYRKRGLEERIVFELWWVKVEVAPGH